MADIEKVIDPELREKYEFYDWNNALDILIGSFPEEWDEIKECLREFEIETTELLMKGGNKSNIPKKIDALLFPRDWKEMKIKGDLYLVYQVRSKRDGKYSKDSEALIEGYVNGHNIDFVKNKVALDVEWNSKDQTFDRDLLAMRSYHECKVISVGVILTRSEELNEVFKNLTYKTSKGVEKPLSSKYGKSTTEMSKLLCRLEDRRNGGCPILAIGIRKGCIVER